VVVVVSRLVRLLVHGLMHQVLILPKLQQPLNECHADHWSDDIPKALEAGSSEKPEGGDEARPHK
jgi:hypothetical protein